MKDLKDIRKKIDEIDTQMQTLFEQRLDIVGEVALYKQEHHLPILDASREKSMMEEHLKQVKKEEYLPYYQTFLEDLIDIMKEYQKKKIESFHVAYQGSEGAFSHLASLACFPNATLISYPTFEDVFIAVKNRVVDFGVVPFENSYTGEVGEILDLLAKYDLCFNKIYDLQIQQNLLGIPGATINDIKDVYSKDQAIAQSSKFLKNRNFTIHEFMNTALAAKYVHEQNDKSKAAIASLETAKLYDLEVIAEDINTSQSNTTRFIVLSRTLDKVGNRFNLSFTLTNEIGSLAKIINIITNHHFNMEKIQSRAIKDLPWEYYFQIEIVGELNSKNTEDLLNELKEHTKELKILGCYTK